MKLTLTFFLLVLCAGCADVLDGAALDARDGVRTLPKSYVAPTPETVLDETEWQHAGSLELNGETQMGRANGLVAFDALLSAGQDVVLHNFSGGWTTVHIFGAERDSNRWEVVQSKAQTTPLDDAVEGGRIEFATPFEGHYLFMIEPILENEVDYLMRLDCQGDC